VSLAETIQNPHTRVARASTPTSAVRINHHHTGSQRRSLRNSPFLSRGPFAFPLTSRCPTFLARLSNKGRRESALSSPARKGGFYPGKPGCHHEHRGRRRRPGDREQQLPPPPPHSLFRGTTSSRPRSSTAAARGPASAAGSRRQ